ncbi:MAG: GNAT family N-acetyltransferase [Symploca sp. SIO3C6]|nr:GNAT family N-acetyltransferase [Symploca sp. SIO3C6]
MNNLTGFSLECSGYSVKQLVPEDAEVLQKLYEQCKDFAFLTYGEEFSSTAAREEFNTVPEGKTTQDSYLFGLFDSHNVLLGMIASLKHYRDQQTWWLGLIMLAPEHRNKGLGADFYRAFECWVSAQGVSQISLCAIKANELGLRFWKKMGFEVIRKTAPRQYGIKTHEVYVLSRTLNCS